MKLNKSLHILIYIALGVFALIGVVTSAFVFPSMYDIGKIIYSFENRSIVDLFFVLLIINETSAAFCYFVIIMLLIANILMQKRGMNDKNARKTISIAGYTLSGFSIVYAISYGIVSLYLVPMNLFSYVSKSTKESPKAIHQAWEIISTFTNGPLFVSLALIGLGLGIGLIILSRYLKKGKDMEEELEGTI